MKPYCLLHKNSSQMLVILWRTNPRSEGYRPGSTFYRHGHPSHHFHIQHYGHYIHHDHDIHYNSIRLLMKEGKLDNIKYHFFYEAECKTKVSCLPRVGIFLILHKQCQTNKQSNSSTLSWGRKEVVIVVASIHRDRVYDEQVEWKQTTITWQCTRWLAFSVSWTDLLGNTFAFAAGDLQKLPRHANFV